MENVAPKPKRAKRTCIPEAEQNTKKRKKSQIHRRDLEENANTARESAMSVLTPRDQLGYMEPTVSQYKVQKIPNGVSIRLWHKKFLETESVLSISLR